MQIKFKVSLKNQLITYLPRPYLFLSTKLKFRKPNNCLSRYGRFKNAYAYKFLKSDVVICYKQRQKANVISHMELIGDVKGKNVVLVDDMVDTASTLTKAAELMLERAKSVRAVCTHGILSGSAHERIENSSLEELIVTDSIPLKDSPKIKILSCAELFGSTMKSVHLNKSIHENFIN